MLPRLLKILPAILLLVLAMQTTELTAQEQPAPKLEDVDDLLLDADNIKAPEQQETAAADNQQTTETAAAETTKSTSGETNVTTNPEDAIADGTANSIRKDVILVLDNSGSMRQNDPDFLTSKAVTEFISGLDEATMLAIIIFDQDVTLAVPLTRVSLSNREDLLTSLDQINYRGLFTDSPAAMERAIYELKNNGREEAQKLIIFMTDGIVDTGNPQEDLDRSKWLRESLAPDAADAGIKIFGIAFTEKADFQLIQSLAQVTGGEYYRVLRAEDLGRVFDQINTIINKPPAKTPAADTQPASAPPPASTTPSPQPPVVIQVPSQPVAALGKEERIRSIIIFTAAAVMIIAVLAILILLLRRGRGLRPADDEYVSEAYVNDIYGYTSTASYKLGRKPTMLGRVAGMDSEHLDYIVIPESTIGRRHSLIEYKDYAYWIVDQGSINGTFVNDVPVTSEVRLKHGDKIRLHKYEFEFVMPEMVDAGMTVISQTVMAAQSPEGSEATELRGSVTAEGEGFEMDFDLTGDNTVGGQPGEDTKDEEPDFNSEDETLMPVSEETASPPPDAGMEEDDEEFGSEDATLMPDYESEGRESETPPNGTPINQGDESEEPGEDLAGDDETIMPGEFNLPEEDATIRKDVDPDDKSFENFFDIGGEDDKDK